MHPTPHVIISLEDSSKAEKKQQPSHLEGAERLGVSRVDPDDVVEHVLGRAGLDRDGKALRDLAGVRADEVKADHLQAVGKSNDGADEVVVMRRQRGRERGREAARE